MATLYTWNGCSNSQAVQVAAILGNKALLTEHFSPLNPLSKIPKHAIAPCLRTDDGTMLTDFGAILVYLCGDGSSTEMEWIGFSKNVLLPAVSTWVFPTLGAMPLDRQAIGLAKQQLFKALGYLDEQLSTRTFLKGDRLSAADVAIVAALNLAFRQVLCPRYRSETPHLTRWYLTCVNQPAFAALGALPLCETEAGFDETTYNAINHSKNVPETVPFSSEYDMITG